MNFQKTGHFHMRGIKLLLKLVRTKLIQVMY
uniref:Uncharacterized protein n=1 Tax=Arundo donax TaxID=35708 RepID=A0A0A8YEB0_ARUDO